MRQLINYLFIVSLWVLCSCGNGAKNPVEILGSGDKSEQGEIEAASSRHLNGVHCANVYVNNPRTNHYTVEVVLQNDYLTEIRFPDGHLDQSHFAPSAVDASGKCSFISDKEMSYQIELLFSMDQCEKMEAQEVQCSGITKSGNRCKRHTSHPSGKCFQHR